MHRRADDYSRVFRRNDTPNATHFNFCASDDCMSAGLRSRQQGIGKTDCLSKAAVACTASQLAFAYSIPK